MPYMSDTHKRYCHLECREYVPIKYATNYHTYYNSDHIHQMLTSFAHTRSKLAKDQIVDFGHVPTFPTN
jgi:hypothetical protein